MFDFRYHALSLAAIFIALVIGLLLGVAIGDKELVSSARTDLRNSLRADVRQADRERDEARAQVEREQDYGDAAYPILTADRLRGKRIGLVMLGDDGNTQDLVRKALEPAGADLQLVAVLRQDVDLEQIAARASDTRYADLAQDPTLLDDLGRRVGIQMVEGGQLVDELRSELLPSVSGQFGNLDGVVVWRPPDVPKDPKAAERLEALQDGIARGLAQTGVKVVGIERNDDERSRVGWYRDRELSSVDNIDEHAGRAALVFVLAGAEGAFGRGGDAQSLLPPVVGPAR